MQKDTVNKISTINATLPEHQLLLRLLKQNSKRLITSYTPPRHDPTEEPFTLSFLLPVGPLGEKEMGLFNKNDGCSVCGEPAKRTCSRCMAIRYCAQSTHPSLYSKQIIYPFVRSPCWQYAKRRIGRLTDLFANRLWEGRGVGSPSCPLLIPFQGYTLFSSIVSPTSFMENLKTK